MPRVVTEHDEANGAINALRGIAKTLKEVGDENVELQEKFEGLQEDMDELERKAAEDRALAAHTDTLVEVIRDYERGILDRDELFAAVKTVENDQRQEEAAT